MSGLSAALFGHRPGWAFGAPSGAAAPITGNSERELASIIAPQSRHADEYSAGNRRLAVVNLHGLRDPQGKHDTSARRGQAERLAGIVTGLRAPEDLTVVCDDLNLLPDSETFEVLGAIGLVDLVGGSDTRLRHADLPLLEGGPTRQLPVGFGSQTIKQFAVLDDPGVSDQHAIFLDV
jgi:hypothetical protein